MEKATMPCIHCPVCRELLGAAVAVCRSCDTPHHPDCWDFGGGCAVFACGGTRARVGAHGELTEPIADIVFLEDSPDPAPRHGPALPASGRPMLPTGTARHAESGAVALVGWVYLAASLRGGGRMVAGGLVAGAAAYGVKQIGDRIATGDERGRTAHLYTCLALALIAPSPAITLLLALLVAPFWTARGLAHFGRAKP
jgi:hypothetical protein